jgi:two-component system KDP operon response regulator KdpE
VLVVDDDTGIRALIRAALWEDPYQVIEAANGEEALAALETQHPVVILLDLGMPILDGPEFVKAAHQRGVTPKICVVSSEPTGRAAASQLGAAAFLPKPFTIAEVRAVVASLVAGTEP